MDTVTISGGIFCVIGNSEEFPITQKALTRQWCAPARRCRLSQATARDKRMCQGVVYFYDWKIQKVPYGTETYYKKTHYNRKRSRTKSVATRITALKFFHGCAAAEKMAAGKTCSYDMSSQPLLFTCYLSRPARRRIISAF